MIFLKIVPISKTACINPSLLKTSENLRFSHVFRGYRTGTLAWNRLKGFFVYHKDMKNKQPQEKFYKKAALKDYTIFTGKHLCWSLFLIKFIKSFIKKRLQHVFSCENCETFKNLYCEEHLQTPASGKILHSIELS